MRVGRLIDSHTRQRERERERERHACLICQPDPTSHMASQILAYAVDFSLKLFRFPAADDNRGRSNTLISSTQKSTPRRQNDTKRRLQKSHTPEKDVLRDECSQPRVARAPTFSLRLGEKISCYESIMFWDFMGHEWS